MNKLQKLHDSGQSLWLDNITRGLLTGGTLGRYIAEFAGHGVDAVALAAELQVKGAQSFVDSWNDLLACIADKANTA
ncbi:MAG TPA: hypothetical protein VKC56_03710 [Gallionellaceae bacterium]|nr:hypothetical protein [Gallionellaceae bacterium]